MRIARLADPHANLTPNFVQEAAKCARHINLDRRFHLAHQQTLTAHPQDLSTTGFVSETVCSF